MEKENESEEKDEVNKKELDKTLKKVFVGIGSLVILLVIVSMFVYSQAHLEYNGAVFKKIKEKDLTFYQTSIPVLYQGKTIPYNFYLRNNPEKLKEEVPFYGNLILLKDVVIDIDENISCEDDKIAVANLVKLYGTLGANVIKNESITCGESETYMYLNIQEANETSVEQFGPSCYNLNLNNCEILKTTERFMIETFAEVKKIKDY